MLGVTEDCLQTKRGICSPSFPEGPRVMSLFTWSCLLGRFPGLLDHCLLGPSPQLWLCHSCSGSAEVCVAIERVVFGHPGSLGPPTVTAVRLGRLPDSGHRARGFASHSFTFCSRSSVLLVAKGMEDHQRNSLRSLARYK